MDKQYASDSEGAGGKLHGAAWAPAFAGDSEGGEAQCRRALDGVAEFVYESRPDAEVMPHVVEVLGVGG